MESEIDLNDSVQELHVIATTPDMYHHLVELNAIKSLLQLIGHENTDISIAVIDLLQELTDVDTLTESEDGATALIDALVRLRPWGWGDGVAQNISSNCQICCLDLDLFDPGFDYKWLIFTPGHWRPNHKKKSSIFHIFLVIDSLFLKVLYLSAKATQKRNHVLRAEKPSE